MTNHNPQPGPDEPRDVTVAAIQIAQNSAFERVARADHTTTPAWVMPAARPPVATAQHPKEHPQK
jgi:hypothetical protein